ncbi:MAG: CDP-archaeol synthase [Magnetococcales bacterium]|nr:CDP-archaeol synthase [Magnetococcales bacterium]
MLTRVLSAVVLAPPLLYLILMGTTFHLFLLMLPVSAGLLYEWQGFKGAVEKQTWLALVVFAWIFLWIGYTHLVYLALPFLLLFLFIMVAKSVLSYQPDRPVIALWSTAFTGLVYCTLPLVLLLEIQENWGGEMVFLPLLVIWATDSGAYFSGKFFGKKKLAPSLSPGKTWVGFYGGCLSGVVAGLVCGHFFSTPFTPWQAIVVGLLLSLSGQLGDLAESLLKRESGIKDSGNLIPGHGGLLDRLDSLLFATPVYYLLLVWIGETLTGGGETLAG